MISTQQQSPRISELWDTLQKYRRSHNWSIGTALGSFVIYFASIASGVLYTDMYKPKNDADARVSISQLESELNSLKSFRSLPYQAETTSLENSLQNYKTELSKTIKGIQADMEKNKNDETHTRYAQAIQQSQQYILPITIASSIPLGLSLISTLYFAKKEKKIKRELQIS